MSNRVGNQLVTIIIIQIICHLQGAFFSFGPKRFVLYYYFCC